jgi:hypothetical protein
MGSPILKKDRNTGLTYTVYKCSKMKKKAFTVRTPSGKHADMGLFCS